MVYIKESIMIEQILNNYDFWYYFLFILSIQK